MQLTIACAIIITEIKKERRPIKGRKVEIMIIKEMTRKEFEERYPEVYISDAGQVAAYLENGVVLTESEWNSESYTIKGENGAERRYRPVEEPAETDENGEAIQWDIVGYEEV